MSSWIRFSFIRIFACSLVYVCIVSSADSQNVPTAEENIERAIEGIESDLSGGGRIVFEQMVLEFHTARTALALSEYVLDKEFQSTFARGYGILRVALAEGSLPNDVPTDTDIALMQNAYSDNFDQFTAIVEVGRDLYPNYRVFSLSYGEILLMQTRFSLIVRHMDEDFWRDATSVWSIFIPMSDGP